MASHQQATQDYSVTMLLGIGQASYYANGGHQASSAFVNGAHYGFYFTFILALAGLLLATRLSKKTTN
ncbi:hypothetical protein WP50_17135 [Lactiplantibacillus plantarum]|nr:hypothetical protein WP50_17135 [Lactiplantibacillus plantarum]